MKKLKVKDWFVFGEWFNLFWFHSCYCSGLAETIREKLGYGLSQVVAEQEGNVQHIYFSRSEWTSAGARYFKAVLKNPNVLQQSLAGIRKAADDLVAFSRKLKQANLKKVRYGRQVQLLNQYHERHHTLWTLGMIPNVIDLENTVYRDYLKQWLVERGLSKSQAVAVFQVMTTPRELSMAQQEERAMLHLALEHKPTKKLRAHWKKFSWLQFGWIGPSLSQEYFNEIQRGLAKQKYSKVFLDKLLQSDRQLHVEKEQWKKKLKMPPEVSRLFLLYEELLFVKAHRMDAVYMSYEAVQPLLREVARRNYLSLSQVYGLYMGWLLKMIKTGSIDSHAINSVAQYSVRYFDGEEEFLLVGDEARAFVRPIKERLPKPPRISRVVGECAYPGKVRGRVSVINQGSEFGKFKKGDILVSNVTDPSFVPIMKKAAAFVTNQGGLTAHAAIISRELHIPCVVGTSIATQVFKDGDHVEVDASKGIVKKI